MRLCYNCAKSPPDGLKLCAKCKSTGYCNPQCQKAHWKIHKAVCAIQAAAAAPPAVDTAASTACDCRNMTINKPFTHIQAGAWLHGHSKTTTYRLLIDAYRLWLCDMAQFEGVHVVDPARATTLLGPAFRQWLTTSVSEKKPHLLPIWWTDADVQACCDFGLSDDAARSFHNLTAMLDKQDILDHYDRSLMPMQMRMFLADVRGHGIGGAESAGMLRMLISQEDGSSSHRVVSVLNANPRRR